MAKPPIPGADLITGLHKKHGRKLAATAIDRLLPLEEGGKRSFSRKIAGFLLLRVATRSVPGAILVGGGLIAKHLHGKNMAKKAADKAQD